MKMTREQVAELLLKANEDLSNVELHEEEDKWYPTKHMSVSEILAGIATLGYIYRIKDNAVKEITPDLLHKVFKHKTIKGCYRKISMIKANRIYFDENDSWTLDGFNNTWQLVED